MCNCTVTPNFSVDESGEGKKNSHHIYTRNGQIKSDISLAVLSTAVRGHQTHVIQRLWTQTELSLTHYITTGRVA